MNLGIGIDKFKVTLEDIMSSFGKSQNVLSTEKIDGSLLIRYIQNDTVKWRTRGSLGIELDNGYEIQEFCEKYPLLNDPNYCSRLSLFFEWVSPLNQIVIKYNEPDLILIGGSTYEMNIPWYEANISLLNINHLKTISKQLETRLTNNWTINNRHGLDKLMSVVEDKKTMNLEGYVLRIEGEQRLVRIKTPQYTLLHAMRSNLTTELLIGLWLEWDKPDFAQYKEKFINYYDYESFQYALPAVSSMFDGIKVAENILNHIEILVLEFKNGFLPEKSRSEFALLAKQRYQDIKLSTCFSLLDGKQPSEKFWTTMIFQNSKKFELRMFNKNTEDENEG